MLGRETKGAWHSFVLADQPISQAAIQAGESPNERADIRLYTEGVKAGNRHSVTPGICGAVSTSPYDGDVVARHTDTGNCWRMRRLIAGAGVN